MCKFVAPSIEKLTTEVRLDCEPELIRAIWKAASAEEIKSVYPDVINLPPNPSPISSARPLSDLKRQAINHAAGFFGVEYLGTHKRNGRSVYYCNAGDTYAPTLCFIGPWLIVSTWGDMIERKQVEAA